MAVGYVGEAASRPGQLEAWGPGHISMCLYGFAMASVEAEGLYAAFRDACERELHRYSQKELSMLAWAFARQPRHRPEGLPRAVVDAQRPPQIVPPRG